MWFMVPATSVIVSDSGIFVLSLRQQIIKDAKLLNAELRRMEIAASIDPRRCTPGGNQLAFYGVKLHGKTKAVDVAKVVAELSRVISQSRRKRTYLRFDEMTLRLETEHPERQPLQWSPRIMERCQPHTAALGISHYDGEQKVIVSLNDVPQILVAGETGSGKTVLLRNLITSVAYGTSPTELRMILIDPKNEDLRPYALLPHVELFAGKPEDIETAIARVEQEIVKRSDDHARKPYRLLVVIDELAWAIEGKDMQRRVGRIMGIGRSKLINVVACTQQPTEEGGMGAMMKANVPLRLVGAVSNGQSYTATRRKNAQADMLPPKCGAFLYIAGLDMYRFHTFLMDDDAERRAVALICDKWGVTVLEPVLRKMENSLVVEPLRTTVEPVLAGSRTTVEPLFPLTEKRPLTDREASEARRLAASGTSKSELCRIVYGSKNGQYLEWVTTALVAQNDSKIIQLRKRAS
jgi:FtsK/SpoIIIE family